MSWMRSLESGDVRRIQPDVEKAGSLSDSANERLKFCNSLDVSEDNAPFIFVEYYESLRMLCEALMVREGFKIYKHVVITDFLKEYLEREELAEVFDRSRELRNNINYYGKKISISKAQVMVDKIKTVFNEIKQEI